MESCLFVVLFLSERHDRYNDPLKYKTDHNLSKRKEKAGFPCVYICNQTRVKLIEIHNIERGIALRLLVLSIYCFDKPAGK